MGRLGDRLLEGGDARDRCSGPGACRRGEMDLSSGPGLLAGGGLLENIRLGKTIETLSTAPSI